MIELSVAVITAAIVGPLSYLLGAIVERARAEDRRPPEPHEALAPVYELPTPKAILTELRGPLKGRRA